MEWEKIGSIALDGGDERKEEEVRGGEGMGEGVLYVKVMTDEQMEILRRQIAVYATICEQLVEMHKALSAHQDSLAGLRFGGLCCDPMLGSSCGHKIGSRQRWTPTPTQLQVLESIFDKGNGTPSKLRIKDLTMELSKLGHISETNVYNWFQNRRARSKRRQSTAAEFELGSTVDKKTKPETSASDEAPPTPVDPSSFNFDEMSSGVCNPSSLFDVSRADNLVGKMFYTGIDHLA